MLRCCCRCCGIGVALFAGTIGLLCITPLRVEYERFVHKLMPPDVIPMEATGIPVAYFLSMMVAGLPYIRHDGLTAFEGFIAEPRVATSIGAYGAEGPGLMPTVCQNGGWCLMRVTHQANKDMYSDPTTDRVEDLMIAANITTTAKFWAPGAQPTLLSIGTSDPRWWQIRDLWSATIPALQRYPTAEPDFKFPPFEGVTKAAFCKKVKSWNPYWSGTLSGDPTKLAPDELSYLVAYNFNRELFGVELTKEEIDMAMELLSKIGALVTVVASSGILPEDFAKRGQEIQSRVFNAIVERSNGFAEMFMAAAEKRGMDGKHALMNLYVSMVGAGMGSPGSTLYTVYSLQELNSDIDKMLPLYKKDPEAFNLEVVRVHGGGGANSNYHVKKTMQWKLQSGKVITEREGTAAMTNLKLASYDPAVWGGPSQDAEYALKFIPGRENRERVLTWLNELHDIRKCPNMTGCAAAPRFCPGAELSQRLVRKTVDFYIDTCLGKAQGRRDEM